MEISAVRDNKDKQKTYQKQLGRYKKAMANEFYLEAMLITYAMLEDRLRSFLYYIGAIRCTNDKKMNVSKTKPILRRLYFGSDEKAKNKSIDINKISDKEKLIRATVNWVINSTEKPDDKYLDVLKSEYTNRLDLEGIIKTLDGIAEWRAYRNELIHGLFNKNSESLKENIKKQVEDGMKYARFIDSQVKALKEDKGKKRDKIRTTMKIVG